MPVRIYDIAKKLNVENKVVLAKAKELGITTARVPSSTLDKITAEYLEQQMGYKLGPPVPAAPPAEPPPVAPAAPAAPSPVAAPPPTPPVSEPATPVPVPLPESAPPPSPPAAAEPAGPPAAAPVAPEHAAPTAPPPVAPLTAPAVEATAPVATPPEGETPMVAQATAVPSPTPPAPASTVPFVAAEGPSSPPEGTPVPPVAAAPVSPEPSAPAVLSPTSGEPTPIPPQPVTPEPPPPPPAPKIGDKVGFIQLPTKPRPPERGAGRTPGRPATSRPEPTTKPRDVRGPQPLRPMAGPGQRVPIGVGPSRKPGAAPAAPAPTGDEIVLKPPVIVRDLAEALKRKPFQLIADLMEVGVFATVNQAIEADVAQRVCAKYNFRFKVEKRQKDRGTIHGPEPQHEPQDPEDRSEDLKTRAPVVTIMGHVDHGKTTLLDVIRQSDVAAGEAGGITQHIGAYTISCPHPERRNEMQLITFLDTPGHAAFSSMRARGAHVTDIVVLVVAANDGVMPQTLEALSHAQAANVPIIVAINKIDHPNANPMRVRQQLQEKGVVPDDWGGDTLFVDVSALTKQGVDRLLSAILLQAELLDLKANPNRSAKGNVVESGLEPGGPTATVLVRKGTLHVGDVVVCGSYHGKVRALINEENKRLREAGPSVAVRLLGLNGVPDAGAEFNVVEDEKTARALWEERNEVVRTPEKERRPKVTLENLFDTLAEERAKVLSVVVKADTQGSVEAIVEALKKIESPKVSLEVIHSAVGTVTESDVLLASASKAIILGFHTRVDSSVPDLAKREGVQIRLYAIIYELIDQVKEAMAGLLDPLLKEAVFGTAEVRRVFALSKGGNVAGCVVTNGRILRGKARVVRRKNTIYEGIIHTLRRFQDEVNEVRSGLECGIRLDGFDDFQEGDAVECYAIEKVPQKL